MSDFDLPLEELRRYVPAPTAQPDLESFWAETRKESAAQPLNPEFVPQDYPVKKVRAYKCYFDAFGGGRACGWLLIPTEETGPRPALVHSHGYHQFKWTLSTHLEWALMGFVVLALDVRGRGEATDWTPYSSGGVRGWMTKGILNEREYFYRGAYMDIVRAVEVVAQRPEVDPSRIGAFGSSQGGGLTLAASALSDRVVCGMPCVPYLCHYARAVRMAGAIPYTELNDYFIRYPEREERAMRTLSYFDPLNIGAWIKCPTLVSTGGRDTTCPPSTVFGIYNRLTCPKEIHYYPYDGHSGGGDAHRDKMVKWAWRYLKP